MPALRGVPVELDGARHGAVVGEPDGGHAELGRALDELGIRHAPSSTEYSEWTCRWA